MKQLCGKNEMRLVDDDAVHKMQLHAMILMSDPDTENNGKLIKWVMEELDLWDEPKKMP